jgi:protein-S-isoprenylcysteine O-methyltransferase Ste14
MPIYAYGVLAVGWFFWLAPFLRNRWKTKAPERRDTRARWGMVLEFLAYSLLWQSGIWTRSPGVWRTALSILFLTLAGLLSWTATRALGRHLRFDAALSADHQLVRSGPYRVLRHPIYTSMFCILLGTGFMIAPWWLLLVSLLVFTVGTEIRVRIEDGLLASRFDGQFREYERTVFAYIPLLR